MKKDTSSEMGVTSFSLANLTMRQPDLNSYFAEINEFPLLDKEEEQTLGRLITAGNEKARRKLINSNLKLVVLVVNKEFSWALRKGFNLFELINMGNQGLIKAVDKWEWQRDLKFSTFAVWWIRAAIFRELRNTGRLIHWPSHVYDGKSKIAQVITECLKNQTGQPTIAFLSEKTGLSVKQVERTLAVMQTNFESLDSVVDSENERTRHELIGDNVSPPVIEQVLNRQIWELITAKVKTMNRKRRYVAVRRLNLDGQGSASFRQIGDELKMTYQATHQQWKKARQQLQKHLRVKLGSMVNLETNISGPFLTAIPEEQTLANLLATEKRPRKSRRKKMTRQALKNIEEIFQGLAKAQGIKTRLFKQAICSPSKSPRLARLREEIVYRLRQINLSFPQIGKLLNRDHSTVVTNYQRYCQKHLLSP